MALPSGVPFEFKFKGSFVGVADIFMMVVVCASVVLVLDNTYAIVSTHVEARG